MKVVCIALMGLWCASPAFVAAADTEPKQLSSTAAPANSHDTDLRALLRAMGTKMHKHFVPHPLLAPSIDLGGLDPQELTYPQLLAVLGINGFIVVPDSGLLLVLPNSEARQAPLPMVAFDNIKTLDDEWVTTVIPLKNMSATQVVPLLRPLLPQYGHLAPSFDRNALLIVDRTANVKRIIEIVKVLDSLPKAPEAPPPKAP